MIRIGRVRAVIHIAADAIAIAIVFRIVRARVAGVADTVTIHVELTEIGLVRTVVHIVIYTVVVRIVVTIVEFFNLACCQGAIVDAHFIDQAVEVSAVAGITDKDPVLPVKIGMIKWMRSCRHTINIQRLPLSGLCNQYELVPLVVSDRLICAPSVFGTNIALFINPNTRVTITVQVNVAVMGITTRIRRAFTGHTENTTARSGLDPCHYREIVFGGCIYHRHHMIARAVKTQPAFQPSRDTGGARYRTVMVACAVLGCIAALFVKFPVGHRIVDPNALPHEQKSLG